MMNWARNKLRAWLGVDNPAPLPVTDDKNIMRIEQSTFNIMMQRAGELAIVHRKVKAPDLPHNVRGNFRYASTDDIGKLGAPTLAFDDAQNAPSWAYLSQQNCGMGFAGYGFLSELSQRSEYRAPTETIAAEATREWCDITVGGKASKKKRKERGEDVDGDGDVDGGTEDKIEQLESAMEEFKLRDIFRQISEQDGFFGRSQLFIDVRQGRGTPDEERQLPLVVDKETIKKGSLKGLKAIEPIWTTPYSYNATDPTRPDFYKPRAWFVIGKRVHASRLLTFVSREVADILKPAYNFGGLSMSQLMEPYVFQWLRTRNSVSDLIHNFSVMCLKTNMAAVLGGKGSSNPAAGQGLLDRAKLFQQTRDNQGLTLLDKNEEDIVAVNVPLSTLDKLQAQAQEHMAAPSHIPLVKLTGITPSGLNASSDGEITVWYDFIRAYQIFFFQRHLMHVLKILQLHLFGTIDDAIGIAWRPLSSPTTKELSEIRKADAETDEKYVNMGAISPDEVRDKIGRDPNSGYDNLEGDAPGLPEKDLAEHGADLDEDKAKADHERTLETQAEAAKQKAALGKKD